MIGRPTQRTGNAMPGVVVTVLVATVVSPLNATMIVVALPQARLEFQAGLGASSLLVTGYLVAMAVLPPIGGRLGDRWNRRSLLLAGLAVFGAAALAGAVAPSLAALVACRLAQAAGGALAFPNALAILRERVTLRRRGLGFGFVGAAMALAAAAGPPLGQLLVSHWGWRWVFAVNVPPVAVAIALGWRSLPRVTGSPQPAADTTDAARASRARLRSSSGLAAAALALGLSNLALYAALVGTPLLLSTASGATQSGLLLTALLATAALAAPIAGRLADVRGRRAVAVGGLCVLAAGFLPLAAAGERLGLQAMAAGLAVAGLGLGASSTAIQVGGIEAVGAAASGAAAGLLGTCRYVGGAAGSSILPLAVVLAPGRPLNALFGMAVVAALLAMVASARLGGPASRTSQLTEVAVGGARSANA
jgi:MFS transporter, DHA2 family, methylenomycin A resistance protein